MKKLKILAKFLISEKCLNMIRQWYMVSLKYKGTRFYCPCCEKSFRCFLPYGDPPRPGAACPLCGSLERHRLLWVYLKNKTNLFHDNLKVLHFAPEYIIQKKLKTMSNLEYISADLLAPAMIHMDITNIIYNDNTIDVVLLSHVFEFVKDDKKAMEELYRVLKPGGWAILQTAIKRDTTLEISASSEEERAFDGTHNLRIYGHDYKEKLESVGFTVKVDNYVRTLDKNLIDRYRLDEKEDIYFCKK